MKKLIAYYSRTGENYFGGKLRTITEGNTAKVAKMIAEITGGDLFEIRQKHPYSDSYMTCIKEAQKDLKDNARPELVALPENMDQYDEVWIGSPVYWGTMPMAVFTFLDAIDWSGKTIHPFCTHEGSGLGRIPSGLAREAKEAKIASGLAVHGSEVDQAKSLVERWISEDGE